MHNLTLGLLMHDIDINLIEPTSRPPSLRPLWLQGKMLSFVDLQPSDAAKATFHLERERNHFSSFILYLDFFSQTNLTILAPWRR
jgi:hypothetical protein